MTDKATHSLTPQQEKFAQGIVSGMSQADAYRSAYPASKAWKDESVHNKASAAMRLAHVSARVDELRALVVKELVIDKAALLQEAARLTFSDPRGIIHPDGRVKLPNELDEATARSVASFKIDEYGRIEYKFWDKNAAMEKLFKHLGLYEKDNEQQKPTVFTKIELVGVKPKDRE